MSVDRFLSRLEKVRKTGADRWMACCPAHEDRTPSLAIRELDDGRILIHCFAQCSVDDITAAVGMELDSLFPEKPIEHAKGERRPFNAHDILAAVADEVQITAVAASRIKAGKPLTAEECERVLVAQERLQEARRIALGSR